MLWLSKVYGIPAGMYASQVWGTVYLSEGSAFGSQLQKRHLCSLRRILGVKNSTTNWAVLRECGQEPLQIFWFRASIRFCLIPTVRLYVVCWRQICILLLLIVLAGLLKSRMRSMDCKEVQCSNRKCWEPHRFPCNSSFAICVSDIWRYGGKLIFSCPRAVNKKAVTFHKWCGSSESGPRGSPFSIPSYMYKDLDKHVLRNFSKFRLRAHQCFFFRDIDVFRRWTYPFWRWAKTLSEHLGLQGTPRQNHLWALRGPSEGRNLAWNQKSFSFKLLKWAMRMRANGQKKSEWWSILERVYGRTCPMQPASYEVWQRA